MMDVGGGGGGQHRLRSRWEQDRSLSSGDAGGRWSWEVGPWWGVKGWGSLAVTVSRGHRAQEGRWRKT